MPDGYHTDVLIDKKKIISKAEIRNTLINELLLKIKNENLNFSTIIGPAYSESYFASIISEKINKNFVYPIKQRNKQIIQDDFKKVIFRKKIIIIDDIMTEGKSCKQIIKQLKNMNGNIVGIFLSFVYWAISF